MAKTESVEEIRFINISDSLQITDIAALTVAAISAVNGLNIPPDDKAGIIHRLSEALLSGKAFNYANATLEEIQIYLTEALPPKYIKHIELVAEAIQSMMRNLKFVIGEK